MKYFKGLAITLAAVLALTACDKEDEVSITIDFEDVEIPSEGFLGGEDAGGAHVIDNVSFYVTYDTEYMYSSGCIISSLTDTETAGYMNPYSAYAGEGAGGSVTFLVINPPFMNVDPMITFGAAVTVESMELCNTTYAYLSMQDGDAFGKQFNAEDEDFFTVSFEGYDASGNSTGTVVFYLADFRNGSNTGILDSWSTVDLSALGSVVSIGITFDSSDLGTYGINTPAYVAVDNIKFVE